MKTSLYLLCAAMPLFAVPPADDAPPWLRQAAAAAVAKYDVKVKSVVLRDETRVVVEEGGKITTSTFYAVRIITRDGRSAAAAHVVYQTGAGKVKELRAWMIR